MESIKETDLALQREVVTTTPNTWLVEAVNPSTGEKKMINVANLSSVVAGQIGTSNSGANSLLRANTYGSRNSAVSTMLFFINSTAHFSISCIVADSNATGLESSIYLLSVSRSAAGAFVAKVKPILGTRIHRIKYKIRTDGTIEIVLYRTQYSPMIGCFVLTGQAYIKDFMTNISDDTIDGTYTDFTLIEE